MKTFLKSAMAALTDDPEGRFIGTAGHRRAEVFLVKTLTQLGARVRKHSFFKEISLAHQWRVEYERNGKYELLETQPGIGTTSLPPTESRLLFVDHGTEEDYLNLSRRVIGRIAVAKLWKNHETRKTALAAKEGAVAIFWYNDYVDDFYSAACDYTQSAIPGFSIKKSQAYHLLNEHPAVRLFIEAQMERIRGNNLIADIGEDYPKILLTAHYDSRPKTPGANDDASGVACCLGLAKCLAERRKEDSRIRVVLFDAEETGCHGSESYVAHLKETGDLAGVAAVINFDAVGWPNLALLEADREADLSRDLIQVTQEIFRKRKYAIITTRSRTGKSDHTPFARHGIPAVWFSDYPNYLRHSPKDTLENIDYRTIEHVIEVVLDLLKTFPFPI